MDYIPDWEHPDWKTPIEEKVSEPLHKRRYEVCNNCEHMTEYKFCNECDCFLPVKTYFKIFDCPLGKWPKE